MTRVARRLVVRARRVLAGGDDREVRPLVAAREHALDELAVHVELGAARERPRPHLGRDRRRPRRGRGVQRGDLVGVLHHADRRDDLGRAHERASTAARAAGRARSAPTCGRRSRRAAPVADEPRDERDRVVGLLPRHDLEQLGLRRRRAAPRGGARRARASPARGQHEHREPFERHRLVAGEVRQVGPDRQQQHVDAELVHALAGLRDACSTSNVHAPSPGSPSMLSAFFVAQYSTMPSSPFFSAQSSSRSRSLDEIHERHRVAARRRDAVRPRRR